MEEFFRDANQFGLSIALMLFAIVALGYWIVKRTVPRELHDYQAENLAKQLDKLSLAIEKLAETTSNNLTTLVELSKAIDSQNRALTEGLKHIEVIRYAMQEGEKRK